MSANRERRAQVPRWARRLIVGLGTAVIVAAVSGGTLGVLGAAAGSGADAGRAAAAFAGLALGVGTPLALVHALVVAPLAAKARHAAWAFVTHLVGGALLASLLSVTLAPVGALGGAVFFALERRYGSE